MGFTTLEDLQGSIELVVFPRIWEQYSALLELDNIVVVDGRVDTRGGDPKILVDKVITNLKKAAALAASSQPSSSHLPEMKSDAASGQNTTSRREGGRSSAVPRAAETESAYSVNASETGEPDVDDPQPPDPFPVGWELNGVTPTISELVSAESEASVEQSDERDQESSSRTLETPDGEEQPEDAPISSPEAPVPSAAVSPLENEEVDSVGAVDVSADVSPIMSPIPPTDGSSVRMLTVVLRPTGDKVRDSLRLRLIYGRLISYPGNDRFAFHIFEKGHGHLLEFPNFTTGVCQDLLIQLHALVGAENVRVEPITFQ
jgi:DNA polymerase-3 subunit alpha